MSGNLDAAKLKDLAISMWRRGGMDTLIEVAPRGLIPNPAYAAGYCTTFKYVVGRTPTEIEESVGLRRAASSWVVQTCSSSIRCPSQHNLNCVAIHSVLPAWRQIRQHTSRIRLPAGARGAAVGASRLSPDRSEVDRQRRAGPTLQLSGITAACATLNRVFQFVPVVRLPIMRPARRQVPLRARSPTRQQWQARRVDDRSVENINVMLHDRWHWFATHGRRSRQTPPRPPVQYAVHVLCTTGTPSLSRQEWQSRRG